MFKCDVCKETMSGEPAMKNAIGSWCNMCKAEFVRKAHAGQRRPKESCIWCGKPFTASNTRAPWPNGAGNSMNIHGNCIKKRDWLLMCIRHSDLVTKYVTRVEEREAPLREQRATETAEQIKLQLVEERIVPDTTANTETRIDRMERLVESLLRIVATKAQPAKSDVVEPEPLWYKQ